MIGSDGKQSCIFSLCAAIGLQAAGIKSGDLAEIIRQFIYDHTDNLLPDPQEQKDEYLLQCVQLNGIISAGCIQFHGAAAERDHGSIQRKIFILQHFDIPHHLAFAVMCVENRVR